MSKKKKASPCPSPVEAGLPPGGADSHAHLDMEEFAADLPEVLERAFASGVSHIGNVLFGPEGYRRGSRLFAGYPQVFFILGIHPCEGSACTRGVVREMREAARADARVRAVGETGLDFYWKSCGRGEQTAAFRAQLGLARELDLPVVVHSRDAAAATLSVLDEESFAGRPLLWHCFGGDAALAGEITRRGWHLSIPGAVGYPSNGVLREAARSIPPDRLLLETDAPYLAPPEWRGKRNEPALSVFTAVRIAGELGMDAAELWEICGRNARRFFGL
jgi:TatD DNase family protein